MRGKLMSRTVRDYSPVSWVHYFDEAHDIRPDSMLLGDGDDQQQFQDTFRVYLKNFQPPFAPQRKPGSKIVNLSHIEVPESELKRHSLTPTLVTLHGGGYSGLTWAQFTQFIDRECKCRILSIDLRNHGDTKTNDDEKMDIDTLVNDVIKVVHATHRLCGFIDTPKIVLIGHSMGGAIAINCASRCTELLPSLAGFVIIDVVEGTAKDALPLMMSVIQTRPTRFPSLSNAIEWSVRSGLAKNLNAARVSMPSNLLNIERCHLGIHDIDSSREEKEKRELIKAIHRHIFHLSIDRLLPSRDLVAPVLPPRGALVAPRLAALRSNQAGMTSANLRPNLSNTLDEEGVEELQAASASTTEAILGSADEDNTSAQTVDDLEIDSDGYRRPPDVDKTGYCWRTDLSKTQPFWNGWFDGLSEQLLRAPVQGKFLLLAGIDRLDKTLTIGQMQGKFMMKVLPKCGHAVHEDVPHEVASAIGQFLVRNKFTTLVGDVEDK